MRGKTGGKEISSSASALSFPSENVKGLDLGQSSEDG